MADDDWRVTVTLHDEADAQRTVQSLRGHQVEDDVRRRLGQHVAMSADGPTVYFYAGTEEAAREAARVVREVLAQHQLNAGLALDRWHPLEGEWEDADAPMPDSPELRQAEHQHLIKEENRESHEHGQAGWHVRADMRSHREAVDLAARLRAEGHPVIRRWKYLILGANNEDDASELAQVVKREAPAGASVHAEAALFLNFGPQDR